MKKRDFGKLCGLPFLSVEGEKERESDKKEIREEIVHHGKYESDKTR